MTDDKATRAHIESWLGALQRKHGPDVEQDVRSLIDALMPPQPPKIEDVLTRLALDLTVQINRDPVDNVLTATVLEHQTAIFNVKSGPETDLPAALARCLDQELTKRGL